MNDAKLKKASFASSSNLLFERLSSSIEAAIKTLLCKTRAMAVTPFEERAPLKERTTNACGREPSPSAREIPQEKDKGREKGEEEGNDKGK